MTRLRKAFAALAAAVSCLRDPQARSRCGYLRRCLRLPVDGRLVLLETDAGGSGFVSALASRLAAAPELSGLDIRVCLCGGGPAGVAPAPAANEAAGRVRTVAYRTGEYYRVLATAKYLVNDAAFPPEFVKRDGQVYLNVCCPEPPASGDGRFARGIAALAPLQRDLLAADFLLLRDEEAAGRVFRGFCLENAARGTALLAGPAGGAAGGGCDALADAVARRVFLGRRGVIAERPVPDNGRPNVLVFAGNLEGNGITASFMNLMSVADLERRNYFLVLRPRYAGPFERRLRDLPGRVCAVVVPEGRSLSPVGHLVRLLFKARVISAGLYSRIQRDALASDFRRVLGCGRFDAALQFSGYEDDLTVAFGLFPGRRAIMAHSDMMREVKVRRNQSLANLRWAYRVYDAVAAVTEAARDSVAAIAGARARVSVVPNAIDAEKVARRSRADLDLAAAARLSMPADAARALFDGPWRRIVAVGRFSPEKEHVRLVEAFASIAGEFPDARLVIVGGSEYGGGYAKTLAAVRGKGLADRVLLVMDHPNAVSIVARCAGLILASRYEGFGLVLAEGDIAGVPVVSTDMPAPRPFMLAHGGTLVPNTAEGVRSGLAMLLRGEVGRLRVDYAAYNADVAARFEKFMEGLTA